MRVRTPVAILVIALGVLACTRVTPTPAVLGETIPTPSLPPSLPTRNPTPEGLPTPSQLQVVGCWNIRTGPGIQYAVDHEECDSLLTIQEITSPWVRLPGDLYICIRAFGGDGSCE